MQEEIKLSKAREEVLKTEIEKVNAKLYETVEIRKA
jgi:hypothetical protein